MQHGSNTGSQAHLVVGRAAEVGYLEQCLETALQGERQVVFVSGEPGIGKTTIVDAFLERIRARTDLRIGHGQCIEQYGAGEAYLPLLEVGTRLCLGPEGEHAIALLRQYAPTWLAQLPGVITDAEWERLQRRVQGATRERMLREAAEVVTRFTRDRGYVFVVEDLHWSDISTLEWLSYIARRQEAVKLLIIGTYRPQDVLVSGHPLRGVVQDLTARNRCEELRVAPLSEQAVSEYLSSRFSHSIAASTLPSLIHRRTGGNPLFMVNVADYLTVQQVLRQSNAEWRVHGDVNVVADSVPQSLHHLIERQLERLPEDAQHMLEVASVVGMEFSAVEVATGFQVEAEAIETQCDDLVRKGQFLRGLGAEEWPDGTLGERYGFLHALYRDVLYGRLAETRRVRLHRRIGERKEAAYGKRVGEIATELTLHFEIGRLYQKAVNYCQLAGGAALQRHARHEAAALLTRGLQLLREVPDSPGRLQQELEFNVTLGTALIGTKGYAAPETERAYRQAWELCQQLGDTSRRFPVLDGLRHYYAMRGEQQMAYRVEEQLIALAQQAQDPALMMWARGSRGVTLLWMGAFVEARTHLESRLALYGSYQPRADLPRYGDPAVMGLSHFALALWMLGYPDQAVQKIQQALALAQQLEDAFSIAYAQTNGSLLHQHRREVAAAQELAEAAITLATDHGLPFWLAAGLITRGWALAERGQTQEGIGQIQQGLHAWRATGAANAEPYFLMLLAESHAKAGYTTEAVDTVTKALTRLEQTEERCWEAELYRLKGEFLLNDERRMRNDERKTKTTGQEIFPIHHSSFIIHRSEEAEACFHKALVIARQQQAKSLELRAALSLARLWLQQDKRDDARALLQEIYDWFTEGFDTKDLQEAEALLVTLGGSVKTEVKSQSAKVKSQKSEQAEGPQPASYSLFDLAPQTRPSALSPQSSALFRNEGDYWTVTFAEKTSRIRDTLGMRYLAQLLSHPHEEIHVLTLAAEEPAPVPHSSIGELPAEAMQVGFTDAGEVLDPQARASYRQRLRDLQEELDEAQAFNDPGRIERLQREIEFLTQELAQAVGLGGRTRKAASVAERARINVTKRIKIALRKINEQHPTLGEYLAQTIRTGTFCEYAPSPHQPVTWES